MAMLGNTVQARITEEARRWRRKLSLSLFTATINLRGTTRVATAQASASLIDVVTDSQGALFGLLPETTFGAHTLIAPLASLDRLARLAALGVTAHEVCRINVHSTLPFLVTETFRRRLG